MEKARSRLSDSQAKTPTIEKQVPSLSLPPLNFLHHYKKYLPTLALGLISWVLFYLLLTRIYPQTVQHWFIPHLYLPVIFFFFLAVFFSTAFIILNTRRGALIALAATTLFFLKLQQVQLTLEVIGTILIFFGILELSFILISYGLGDALVSLTTTKRKPRANLRQKTKHRKRN